MKKTILSVIIPVYNAERYIIETVDSILEQDLEDFEIILIDDGSTDNSYSIIEQYLGFENVRIYHQENQGATVARNRGIRESVGKYILFFDADDVLEKNVLKNLVLEMENKNGDILISDFCYVNSNLKFIRRTGIHQKVKEKKLECFNTPPYPGNKIYKREIICNNNIMFDKVKIGQDLNFYLKYLLFSENILVSNACMTKYRQVNNSISNTKSSKIMDIIKSLCFVQDFYICNSALLVYIDFLQLIKLKHYVLQFSKLRGMKECTNFNEMEQELSLSIKSTLKDIKIKSFKEFYMSSHYILSYVKTKLYLHIK